MLLKPVKCSFEVWACKFLGFMLTIKKIQENPDKYQAIIGMRNPTTVKDVQQLTGCMVALSICLFSVWDKVFHVLSTFKKNGKFYWENNVKRHSRG